MRLEDTLNAFLLYAVFLFFSTTHADEKTENSFVKITENGKVKVTIVLPDQAHADEKLAASELAEHLEKITGDKVSINTKLVTNGKTPVFIGAAAPSKLTRAIKDRDDAAFVISVKPDGVAVRGNSPEGTLFGVYELLERLGVRWFMPGEFGTVLPKEETLSIAVGKTTQVPSFKSRHLQTVKTQCAKKQYKWYRRMRLGGEMFPSAHGIPIGKDATFEARPDLYALHNGKRHKRQVCLSNPDTLRLAIENTKDFFRKNPGVSWLGMGPNDGSGTCECESCLALDGNDWDPLSNERSVTDRYIWFFNQVLAGIKDEFPDKKICFYIYHNYQRPPVKFKPDPGICGAFAPISLCRIHGMANPVCPERGYYGELMEKWGKLLPELYERGYYYNLACPGFPFNKVHAIREETPLAKAYGVKGWRVQSDPHWGSMTPTLYLATKLFWNSEADVDKLKYDFYKKFFGPAAVPMEEYLEMMDAALKNADHHTGCSFDLPHIYTPAIMKKAERLLDQAKKQAKEGTYAARVAAFRLTFDYMKSFFEMLEYRNNYDFVTAKKALDKTRRLMKSAVDHEPPLLFERNARSYMKRFFSQCVDQGYERTTGEDRFIAGAPDEWDFILDPMRIGESLGYHKKDLIGGNWRKLKTMSNSWSNQGLRYYKGEAWYRTEMTIPETFTGERVFLWFGGVDEKVKVWVNGQLVGVSPGSAFLPFEFDVTKAARPGRNVIAVRLVNSRVDELGTGGVTAPVMLYIPASNREINNSSSQKLTFP